MQYELIRTKPYSADILRGGKIIAECARMTNKKWYVLLFEEKVWVKEIGYCLSLKEAFHSFILWQEEGGSLMKFEQFPGHA